MKRTLKSDENIFDYLIILIATYTIPVSYTHLRAHETRR